MTKTLLQIACAALLFCQPARAETFLQKILRTTGISATPSQQRALGEEMEGGGEIRLADVKTGSLQKLSASAGFRSPIFTADDRAVLAVKDGKLWRISLAGGPAQKLHDVAGLTKLVGLDRDDPDKILVIIERARVPVVALLSIASGKTTEIRTMPKLSEDRKLLSHLKGWERVYGDTKIYPQAQTREGLAGTVEWHDVFLKKGDAEPFNVSRCDGANCGQPSLSGDETKVVFIHTNL